MAVERYTDSDRFEQPIMHDVGPIDEELSPAPPAPARQDLIGQMFPRLSAAMDLFGKIDLSRFRQARGDAGRKKVDEAGLTIFPLLSKIISLGQCYILSISLILIIQIYTFE